jgi:hypothetical protein
MCSRDQNPFEGAEQMEGFIQSSLEKCKLPDLAFAMHAAQDNFAKGHNGCQPWHGVGRTTVTEFAWHAWHDNYPDAFRVALAEAESRRLVAQFMQQCPCVCQ